MNTENNVKNEIREKILSMFPNSVEYGDGQAFQMFIDTAKKQKEEDMQEASKLLYMLLEKYKKEILLEDFSIVSAKVLSVSDEGMVRVELFSDVKQEEQSPIAPSTFFVGVWTIPNTSIYQNLKEGDNVLLLIPGKKQSADSSIIIGVHNPSSPHFLDTRNSLKKLPETTELVSQQQKQIADLTKQVTDLSNKVNQLVSIVNGLRNS